MRLSLLALVVASIVLICARGIEAGVMLQSTEVTRETKHLTAGPIGGNPDPPQTSHEVVGPNPFPNDGDNFARVGPDGLTVGVDLTGRFSHAIGNYLNDGATDYRFRVTFDVDEPALFTYSQRFTVISSDRDEPTFLQREGDAPVRLLYSGAGTLTPGRYTFSGATPNLVAMVGSSIPDRFYSFNVSFADVRLNVAPEPAALMLVATPLLMLRRRRPRVRAS
jgi:hypothetical protein